MRKAAFFCDEARMPQVFGGGRRERIGELCDLHPVVVTSQRIDEELPHLADLDVIVSTWGMFPLTQDQLAQMPKLKALFHAAGSVKRFATSFLEAGVTVVSAWAANAIPTAGYTVLRNRKVDTRRFRCPPGKAVEGLRQSGRDYQP